MTAPTAAASELDRLATELAREVRHAAGARASAELVAALHGMTRDVDAAATEIEQVMAVLHGPSALVLPDTFPAGLRARADWVQAQVAKARQAVEKDPMRVRQGPLWRETQKAFNTLRSELLQVLDDAYSSLLDPFAADDRRVLETLPPGTSGLRDYRAAIEDFEHAAAKRPRSVEDIKAAAAVGRRLKSVREKVEVAAIPAEFQDQWRRVRASGLPMPELTDAFMDWLREQGLAGSTVLMYRAQ